MAVILLALLTISGLFSATTYANINPVVRMNEYSCTFDNPSNFANLKEVDSIKQTWHADNVGDSTNYFFIIVSKLSYAWTGNSNVGVSNVVYNSGEVDALITSLTGNNGITT